jgi:hypothetical protein
MTVLNEMVHAATAIPTIAPLLGIVLVARSRALPMVTHAAPGDPAMTVPSPSAKVDTGFPQKVRPNMNNWGAFRFQPLMIPLAFLQDAR